MKSLQKGFTLIELMIVVAIIAILAAIAIPAYQNYLIRAQVTEGMTLMDGAKVAVTEYYANHGAFPTDADANAQVGMPASPESVTGKYVSQVAVIGGTTDHSNIVSTFNATNSNAAIQDHTITLTGSIGNNSENIVWHCNGTGAAAKAVDAKYLPSSCR